MPCTLDKNPDERKCKVANVAERRRKLASYEVAGTHPRDSPVLKGRWIPPSLQDAFYCGTNQTRCVWLISSCPFGTKQICVNSCNSCLKVLDSVRKWAYQIISLKIWPTIPQQFCNCHVR